MESAGINLGINVANENLPPPIFKLNVDCCDELFDYLSLVELHSLAQTCKAMQKITGIYFRRNFTKIRAHVTSGGGYRMFIRWKGYIAFPLFKPFATGLQLLGMHRLDKHFDFTQFKSVNRLTIDSPIFHSKLCGLASILPKIDTLVIRYCENEIGTTEFFEEYLSLAANLRTLEIISNRGAILNENNNEWLKRKYPSLQKVVLDSRRPQIAGLRGFLEMNPNIRWLGMERTRFLVHGEELFASNVKLDDLTIDDDSYFGDDYPLVDWQPVFHLLQSLYDRGFYKRVHISMEITQQNDVNLLASISGLHSLRIMRLKENCVFSSLKNIKCFYAQSVEPVSFDMSSLGLNYIINLEYIYIYIKSCENLSFIEKCACEMANLTSLDVIFLKTEKPTSLDIPLFKWNEKRQKLRNARKLIIYIENCWFYITKWHTRNGDLNLSLIEIRRRRFDPQSKKYFLKY